MADEIKRETNKKYTFNKTDGCSDVNELLDLVTFGFDPIAKVWVAEGQPPVEFVLEHENIVILAERVWKILPEIKELNAIEVNDSYDGRRRNNALYDQLTIVERLEDAYNKSEFETVVAAIKNEIKQKLVQPDL